MGLIEARVMLLLMGSCVTRAKDHFPKRAAQTSINTGRLILNVTPLLCLGRIIQN
jgi:hypothetical protein